MKLITYRKNTGPVLTGVVEGDRVLDITAWIAAQPVPAEAQQHHARAGVSAAPGGIMRWLQLGSESIELLALHVHSSLVSPETKFDLLNDAQLYAPVPRPGKIIGVGRNYADHAKETGVLPFENPRIIFKASSSVIAPGVPVPRPHKVTKMDFEVE